MKNLFPNVSENKASIELIQCLYHDENKAILTLRLNHLQKANSYNDQMLTFLDQELEKIIQKKTVRAIIITGSGNRSFCAGSDKDELRNRSAEDGLYLKSRALFNKLEMLPIITIAAINGAAVGGGFELALACDIRVCSTTATFFFPEIDIGLTPAAGGMRRLPSIIGKGRAKEMILFDRMPDAHTALEWGIVSYVGDDFEEMALALAKKVIMKDFMAISLAKKMIDSEESSTQINLEAVIQALLYERKFHKDNS